MRRFFLRRVDYARAALRRTGEHDALVTSPREWLVDPTAPVARPSRASAEEIADTAQSSGVERPPTGPQLEVASGVSHASLVRSPGPHWLMWLVLPMIGAGIAVAAMFVIGPDFGRAAEPPSAVEAAAPVPIEESPSEIAERTPTTLAARDYAAQPEKPPGTIRWWFSTSPKGAQVFIDGEPRGITPTFVNVPIGEQPLEIRLELAGYEPHTLQLPPANDQTFAPQLQKIGDVPEDKPASKKRVRKPSAPADEVAPAEVEPTPGKKTFVPVPDSLRNKSN
jgi:serine/threonine-protein kinase